MDEGCQPGAEPFFERHNGRRQEANLLIAPCGAKRVFLCAVVRGFQILGGAFEFMCLGCHQMENNSWLGCEAGVRREVFGRMGEKASKVLRFAGKIGC